MSFICQLICAKLQNALIQPTDVVVSIPALMRVGEGDGIVQVCATLSAKENTERRFIVSLVTENDTGM